MSNPYEENEFEREDHFCCVCGCPLTYQEWCDFGDICEDCCDDNSEEE